jgi:non-hemolytic enterotoxin B/C
MTVQLSERAGEIDSANKAQASQGLTIQTYCQSVKSQPNVNFAGFENLKKYETEINTGLGRAQSHADTYLNVIQPNIIANIANISNYYALHNAVPTVLPSGSTEEKWIEVLTALQQMAAKYQGTAEATVISINGLYNNLTQDAASFAQTVSNLNGAVDGNNGVLAQMDQQLASIQSQIDGTIAGIVVSGLAIVGGIFITAIGGIASFVTAGTSTPLVALGVGITIAGVAGTVGASLALKGLYDAKANLLTSQATLRSEVKLAQGISTAFTTLSNQVNGAITAARQMSTAWDLLGNDLGTLSDNLKNGIQNADAVRTLFLTAADSVLQNQVVTDIATIKQQMTGVIQIPAVSGRSMAETIDALERQAAMV